MMKRIAITVAAMLSVAGTAGAAPIALPNNEPIFFQFNNIEQVNAANNLSVPGYAPAGVGGAGNANGLQGNWGLFNVSTMQHGGAIPVPPHDDIAGGTPFFADDGVGGTQGQVTGIFYGLNFNSATTSVGGVMDIYWHDAGTDTIDNACLNGVTCLPDAATVARFTTGGGGVLLARLNFAFGIIPGNGAVTLSANIDPTTEGGSGHGDGFADVNTSVAGAWRDALNGNWFFVDGPDAGAVRGDSANEFRDLRFGVNFNVTLDSWDVGPAGTQGIRSNDPARVFTADTVPEPATLTLLGLGLAGLARRRKKA